MKVILCIFRITTQQTFSHTSCGLLSPRWHMTPTHRKWRNYESAYEKKCDRILDAWVNIYSVPRKRKKIGLLMELDDLRAARLVASDPSAPLSLAKDRIFYISCSTVCSKAKDTRLKSGEREKSLPWLAQPALLIKYWSRAFITAWVCQTHRMQKLSSHNRLTKNKLLYATRERWVHGSK